MRCASGLIPIYVWWWKRLHLWSVRIYGDISVDKTCHHRLIFTLWCPPSSPLTRSVSWSVNRLSNKNQRLSLSCFNIGPPSSWLVQLRLKASCLLSGQSGGQPVELSVLWSLINRTTRHHPHYGVITSAPLLTLKALKYFHINHGDHHKC